MYTGIPGPVIPPTCSGASMMVPANGALRKWRRCPAFACARPACAWASWALAAFRWASVCFDCTSDTLPSALSCSLREATSLASTEPASAAITIASAWATCASMISVSRLPRNWPAFTTSPLVTFEVATRPPTSKPSGNSFEALSWPVTTSRLLAWAAWAGTSRTAGDSPERADVAHSTRALSMREFTERSCSSS